MALQSNISSWQVMVKMVEKCILNLQADLDQAKNNKNYLAVRQLEMKISEAYVDRDYYLYKIFLANAHAENVQQVISRMESMDISND